jgi:hypothetical protein
MWRLLTSTKELTVALCERCAGICEDGCRRPALRERELLDQLWLGVRV